MICGVPKSESVYSATSSDPAAMPGLICGSVTRRKASQREWLSVCAASTTVPSNERREARVVR
jgi:hypothetical protein